jgi:hypothetical protein
MNASRAAIGVMGRRLVVLWRSRVDRSQTSDRETRQLAGGLILSGERLDQNQVLD